MANDDLISRADVLDLVQSYGPATYDMPYGNGDMIIRPEDVMALPAVDAVLVVRCKDCKNWDSSTEGRYVGGWCFCEKLQFSTSPDWFCASGEAKDGGENDG